MPWRVEFNPKFGVVFIVYTGRIRLVDIQAATFRTIELVKEHHTALILIDCSELKTAISTMEIYQLPEFYDSTEASRQSKWALILPPAGQIREDTKFYSTVCQNRGWYLQAFDARQEAVDWLLTDSDKYRTDSDGRAADKHDRPVMPPQGTS